MSAYLEKYGTFLFELQQ